MGEKTDSKFRVLRTKAWLKLREAPGKHGVRYEVGFYLQGINQTRYKTIAHDERKAIELWNEISKDIPSTEDSTERERWLGAQIVSPPKLAPKRGFDINFGKTALAKRLEKYCELEIAKPISRSSKSRTIKLCRDLLAHAGDSSSLTNDIVKKYFKSLMNPKDHASTDLINKSKGKIKSLGTWLGIRSADTLFEEIYFPKDGQLKKSGVKLTTKNRTHLERKDAQKFVKVLVNESIKNPHPVHGALFIQLLSAARPTDATTSEIFESSIKISVSKTEDDGVDSVVISRSPVIDAYLFLTKAAPTPVNTKSAAAEFKRIAKLALGEDAEGLDRYCLRHTVLTWAVRCWDSHKVTEMAGHTGPRMLEDWYVSRQVLDKREWDEAMPLNIDGMPLDWHGFLLECVLAARFPILLKGEMPEDDHDFDEAIRILNSSKKKRKKLSLV